MMGPSARQYTQRSKRETCFFKRYTEYRKSVDKQDSKENEIRRECLKTDNVH